MTKRNGSKKTAKRDVMPTLDLAHEVRNVHGQMVRSFRADEADWRLFAQKMQVAGEEPSAAAILSGQAAAPPKVHTMMLPGYEVVQSDPRDERRAVRFWVPMSQVVGERMPLRLVEQPGKDGKTESVVMGAIQAERFEAEREKMLTLNLHAPTPTTVRSEA